MDNSSFPYGSVLKVTRRDSLNDIENNLRLMKEYGLNTIVLWPAAFWWEEKTELYPFNTGRKILELAERYEIKVIVELAGQLSSLEYLPDFLDKPEYTVTTLEGAREFGQASFGFVNYFHPEVKAIILEHCRKAALAYRNCKALLGYDVFNETMYRSFDAYTMADFQAWLKEKYGSIERLNEVWERTYSDFSQIRYECWKWMSVMPQADYCAYRKAAIPRFLKPWCDAIREVDPEHPLIADNIFSMVQPNAFYTRPQDDYSLTEFADEIGMSFYPKQVSGAMEPALRWEIFDAFFDASKRRGFFLSEMQTHLQAMFTPTSCVLPHELKFWCTEAYCAGAKALIYWMWRPFDTGLQTLGRGLVNHQMRPTERLEMAKNLGEEILRFGPLSPLRSPVAILFNPLTDDLQRTYTEATPIEDNLYLKSIFGAYKAFFDQNVRADIVQIDEIADYKLLILTNEIVISSSIAEKLAAFVRSGGIVLMDGRSGITDELALSHKLLPGGEILNPLIGEEYFDTDCATSDIKLPGFGVLKCAQGRYLCEAENAEILARFAVDDKPAVVRKQSGDGAIITFNSSVWYEYACSQDESIKRLAGYISDGLSLRQAKTSSALKLRLSQTASGEQLLFTFNYTDQAITAEVTLPQASKSLEVTVPAQDVRIFPL